MVGNPTIKEKTQELSSLLELKREDIIEVLLEYESYTTAIDELERSLKCLHNIDSELEYLTYGKVDTISAFFPLNLPLYSTILFGVVPGFMANKIYIRPPLLMRGVLRKIHSLLHLKNVLPDMKIIELERHLFLDGYASISDVILFTGRYENAKAVEESCMAPLFIFNGAGINPVVITKSADIELATQKTMEMRLFNSGQDCAGPDAILVDQRVLSEFMGTLLKKLATVKIGSYLDKKVQVGRLIDSKHVLFIGKILSGLREKIIYGGAVNYKDSIVYPTVILDTLEDGSLNYQEFFAPVFYVLPFTNMGKLDSYFLAEEYVDNAMYVSVFGGSPEYTSHIKGSVILKDKIINDVEEGNKPYGGYGERANFVASNGKMTHSPILISRTLCNHLKSLPLNKTAVSERS
ncbi:MAG: aldehyde dehydrogenase family protein [Candidatus Jorgensenbacteria bacterium]